MSRQCLVETSLGVRQIDIPMRTVLCLQLLAGMSRVRGWCLTVFDMEDADEEVLDQEPSPGKQCYADDADDDKGVGKDWTAMRIVEVRHDAGRRSPNGVVEKIHLVSISHQPTEQRWTTGGDLVLSKLRPKDSAAQDTKSTGADHLADSVEMPTAAADEIYADAIPRTLCPT